MELAGEAFVITGAAFGLGEGTARLFAAAGANVVVADLDAEAGERVTDELGDRARFFPTDVADEASVRTAVAGTLETFGSIHGAVNCRCRFPLDSADRESSRPLRSTSSRTRC